jgi:glutamine synthetase
VSVIEFIGEVLDQENKEKYLDRKLAVAERSPKELGTPIKTSEILFHHEVTNQYLWSRF